MIIKHTLLLLKWVMLNLKPYGAVPDKLTKVTICNVIIIFYLLIRNFCLLKQLFAACASRMIRKYPTVTIYQRIW